MHILIAPNAFKNSLSATAAANAIRKGLEESRLPCTCTCLPIADGGDGTAELLVERLCGTTIEATVEDPLGRPISATFGLLPGGIAIIEMASASGLRLLSTKERHPLLTSSAGTGQLIRAAAGGGARQILLAVGGSATVDGGAGILHALGIRFLDENGNDFRPTPNQLHRLRRIDLSGLYTPQILLTILCDVNNPLLGPNGAATVFGPQKGATPSDVAQLEAALTHFRNIVLSATHTDMAAIYHGGAAGGTAAGLHALLDAQLVSGADYFLRATQFDEALADADLVITGEGSLDAQTLEGKGPFAVAQSALAKGIPVIAFAGKVPEEDRIRLKGFFEEIISINEGPVNLEQALRNTEKNLIRAARQTGDRLATR
jgi:glycerate kinase